MVTPEKEEKVEIKHTIGAQQTQKSEEISGQQEHACLELSQSAAFVLQATMQASVPAALITFRNLLALNWLFLGIQNVGNQNLLFSDSGFIIKLDFHSSIPIYPFFHSFFRFLNCSPYL